MARKDDSVVSWLRDGITRRRFIQIGGTLAAGAATVSRIPFSRAAGPSVPDPATGAMVRRTGCMMCNAGCGIQVRVLDGVVIKVDGNPFCAQTNDYDTGAPATGADVTLADLPNADTDPGSTCPRGQAGLMTLYDPLRLTRPLKRTGARGSGQWQAISWEQAIREIAWGGALPDGSFAGLASIRDVAGRFTAADTAYASEAKAGDPSNYGLKSNHLVMMVGRDQTSAATGRFMTAFGSVNRIDHTSICNSSYKVAGYITFCQDNKDKGTYLLKPDFDGANYVVLFGTNPLEANVPVNTFIRKIGAFKRAGGRLVVIDPRFSNTAAKADWWIGGIRPGTDGALALGVCRWLIDNGRHATDYLRRSHRGAPNPAGSTGWTDATYLVHERLRRCLTAQDAGLDHFVARLTTAVAKTATASSTTPLTVQLDPTDAGGAPLDLSRWPSSGNVRIGSELFYYSSKNDAARTLSVTARKVKGTKNYDHAVGADVMIPYVIAIGGALRGYHEATAATGLADLEYRGTIGADSVKSAFALLRDSLDTVANYAAACGVSATDIALLGTELTAAGTRACVDLYRGPIQHTNGTYSARAIHLINLLLDRVDRRGGFALGKRYRPGTPAHPGAPSPTGVRIDRAASKYEGVPATPTRPWYPLAYTGVQQEVFPSIKIGYPYPIKALITFTSNPAYTMPYTHSVIDGLLDRRAVPLHVAVDIFMSETSELADYVLPDVTFYEKWAANVMTGYATVHTAGGTIRQPVVGNVDPVTRAFSPVLPGTRSMDDILIALGKELGLPGYGANGMGAGKHLHQAWQFYNEMYKSGDFGLTNGLEDPAAAPLVMGGRRKNPAAVYDASGNFINDDAKYSNIATIYAEWISAYRHSYVPGEYFNGLPIYEPPRRDARGNPVTDPAGLDLTLNTYKIVQHVQSRSTSNRWLLEVMPENGVWIHPSDAASRGIADGDLIRLRSVRYALLGRAQLTEGIQPGCIAIPHSFGRWASGFTKAWMVDGVPQPHDPAIGAGIAHNPLVRPDPALGDVCLTDPIGGSADFFSTRVAVERA